jgi:U3 small nucleolar RNA-associated protein 14
VDNYEYELPSDFEDEEIDEEMAFTAEDKKLYAGWFGEEEEQEAGNGGDADGLQRRSKRSKLGEFADLESSSEEEQEGEDDEVGHAH